MTKQKHHIVVDNKTYERIKELSSKLGTSISSTIRLLVFSVDIGDEDRELLVLVNPSYPYGLKRIRVLSSQAYYNLLREYTRLIQKVKELEKEKKRLEQKIEELRDISFLSRRIKELEEIVEKQRIKIKNLQALCRGKIEKIRNESRQTLEKTVMELEKEKENMRQMIESMEQIMYAGQAKYFIDELRRHGLLGEAQKFLRGEPNDLDQYIIGDDAYYMILSHKEHILRAKPGKEDVKKPLFWVT